MYWVQAKGEEGMIIVIQQNGMIVQTKGEALFNKAGMLCFFPNII